VSLVVSHDVVGGVYVTFSAACSNRNVVRSITMPLISVFIQV
jgi:hypothetical protein